jgi:hypothetical protein
VVWLCAGSLPNVRLHTSLLRYYIIGA